MSKREAYTRKAEAKLAEKRAEIDKAKARARGAGADAELEATQALDELESKYEAAKRRLGELAEAGEDAWQEVGKGFEAAWDDVVGAAKKVFARLRS